ncbi:Cleavage and polyadenylation specificity factor subunit [Trichinella spiralis]|uniref:Cleavage and polyadenylation specificity factor subunit 4 n=1 Tax=Trichinella spiralis TaxID=6334 RepID=A0ABR3KN93_TRISP
MASYALYSPSQSPVRLELTHFSRTAILSFGSVTFGKTAQQSFLVVNNKQCDQQFSSTFHHVDNEAALVPAKGEIECVVKWKPTETGNFRLSLPLKVTMFPSDEDEYVDVPIRYWLRATLVGSCVLPQEISLKQKKLPLCMQRIPKTSAIKSNVKMGREFESEKLSARPNRIQANHNSQQSVRKDANFKLPFVEHVFTTFLNHLLTQDFITDDSNSEATQGMLCKVNTMHIDPESKLKDCPWYDRGFCRHGPHCKNRHRRRVMCLSFLNGFCPDGPKCLRSHPNFDLPNADISSQRKQQSNFIVCHHCGEIGHKVSSCPNLTSGEGLHTNLPPFGRNFQAAPSDQTRRPLQDVTCYKCGDKGHYANKCSRGTFAFLAPTAALSHEARLKDEHVTHANVPQQRLQGRRAGEMKR